MRRVKCACASGTSTCSSRSPPASNCNSAAPGTKSQIMCVRARCGSAFHTPCGEPLLSPPHFSRAHHVRVSVREHVAALVRHHREMDAQAALEIRAAIHVRRDGDARRQLREQAAQRRRLQHPQHLAHVGHLREHRAVLDGQLSFRRRVTAQEDSLRGAVYAHASARRAPHLVGQRHDLRGEARAIDLQRQAQAAADQALLVERYGGAVRIHRGIVHRATAGANLIGIGRSALADGRYALSGDDPADGARCRRQRRSCRRRPPRAWRPVRAARPAPAPGAASAARPPP